MNYFVLFICFIIKLPVQDTSPDTHVSQVESTLEQDLNKIHLENFL